MIKIQPTQTPTIIKLESDTFLVRGSYEYKNIDEAKQSPLAQQLFYLPFIKTVYISGNFIALERYSIVDWADVQQEVAEQVQSYLDSGKAVVIEEEAKREPFTIYTESTPNPSVMKFVANKRLVNTIHEFNSIDQAVYSPLATALFHFPFVKEVFFDNNYISITKYDVANWDDIHFELREFIREYLVQGKEILSPQTQPSVEIQKDGLDEISQKIVNILDEYVRPAVAGDGGNIRFEGYDSQTKQVKVMLQGACSGCPSSKLTLKNGIETILKDMLQMPEITVEAING